MQSLRNRNRKKHFAKKSVDAKIPVTADDAWRMYEVFNFKNWTSIFGYERVMERYRVILSRLNENQKALMLDLTRRFLWKTDYTEDIVVQLNRIVAQYQNYSSYYALRCIKKDDERKAKSSALVLYEIKSSAVKTMLAKPIIAIDNMKEVKRVVKDFSTSLFILVDDFVGTADTAAMCVEQLVEMYPSMKGRFVVMCVAALKQGIARLKQLGISVFASYIQGRGINDIYRGDVLNKNVRLMEEIEAALKVGEAFRFGYGRSEALVCLKRCPNNTFPIYWHGSNSPYSRY